MDGEGDFRDVDMLLTLQIVRDVLTANYMGEGDELIKERDKRAVLSTYWNMMKAYLNSTIAKDYGYRNE